MWACSSGEVRASSSSQMAWPSARRLATTPPIRSVFQATTALCSTARQEKVFDLVLEAASAHRAVLPGTIL